MADYLPTNTARIRVTQTGPRGTHKMVFRVDPASTIALAMDEARSILTLMLPYMLAGSTWESAEVAAEGSDVFLPATFAPITGAAGETAANATPYGLYLNFVGRTTAGSRVAFYLFNVGPALMTANNRLTPAEHSLTLPPLLAAFNGATGILAGIDQNSFVMKGYANSGIHDRVARKSRAIV